MAADCAVVRVVRPGHRGSLKIKLSRAATFQSLSLLGIGSYLAVMAIVATALRHSATIGAAPH